MSQKVFQFLLLLIISAFSSDSARILAIMPQPSYSHQIVFNPLWLALNSRGHHITLFTTDPIKAVSSSTFRQIDWSFTYKLWHEKHNASAIINNFNKNLLKCMNQYTEMMSDIFTQELEYPQVQEILHNENEHFDLVIAEILNPVMIAFSRRFNCPFIGVSPMDVTSFVHEGLSNPVSPALFPDFLSQFDSEMNFIQRVVNTLYYVGSKLYLKFYMYPKMDGIVKKFFGGETPTLEEMQSNASLVILNTNPIIHDIRPLAGNVITIGSDTHFEDKSELPPEIKKFLDEATSGAVYFSFGTNVKSKDLPEKTKRVFVETFAELPYKFLWKFEDKMETTSNTIIKQWLPQQAILRHPNLKLFITQGGLQSLAEAVYYKIPIIAMPFYIDQYSNVRRVVRRGMGIQLDCNNLDKKVLSKSIIDVISEPKYKRAAERLSVLLRDKPISGIDKSVLWIEYIIKHKGAKLLKNPQIPLYQYLLLDVLFFFLATGILLIFAARVLLKLILLVGQRRSEKSKLE